MPEAKNVLVTGGAGFIGSALIRQLLKSTEHSICNLDKLTYAANPAALTEVQQNNKYQFHKIDITNSKDVQNIIFKFQPDIINHLAAETHVDRSIDSSDAFMLTNVLGTQNLLKASLAYWESLSETKAIKFRFHHISTDEVYGDLGKHGGVFKEESPYHPSSPYSASKASSDHLVRAWYRTYGLPILITNCSQNYGPFQHCEKLIPKVITNVIRGEEIPREHRGYAQFDELIRFIEDRPGHDVKYALDAQKLETELHWKPKESFENGLEKTVKWFINHSDFLK